MGSEGVAETGDTQLATWVGNWPRGRKSTAFWKKRAPLHKSGTQDLAIGLEIGVETAKRQISVMFHRRVKSEKSDLKKNTRIKHRCMRVRGRRPDTGVSVGVVLHAQKPVCEFPCVLFSDVNLLFQWHNHKTQLSDALRTGGLVPHMFAVPPSRLPKWVLIGHSLMVSPNRAHKNRECAANLRKLWHGRFQIIPDFLRIVDPQTGRPICLNRSIQFVPENCQIYPVTPKNPQMPQPLIVKLKSQIPH